tara:strand:- start:4415 stop:4804 length:390 start_codon:yes stop_codon:yes gene_type:complete
MNIVQNIVMINVSDWDTLVEKTYGRPYNFQQQEGCQSRGTRTLEVYLEGAYDYENTTLPEETNGDDMGVNFAAWLARDPKEGLGTVFERGHQLDLFWERNFYPSIERVAQDLCERGLLEEGEYLINIDW